MAKKNKKIESQLPLEVKGAGGGKGGGGRAPIEAENTLRSAANVRVLELISEGEIVGLVDGAKSIYLNDTPVQSEDDTFNFTGVKFDQRFGLPSQSPMEGFPSSEAEVGVNTEIRTDLSPIKAVSESSVDAVRVTIGFPNGLYKYEENGDQVNNKVEIAIDHRLSGGSWMQVGGNLQVEGKTTRNYEKIYYVPRPTTGNGIWEVRVRRITADSASQRDVSTTFFSRITEIQEVRLEYPDSAYIGIAVDAESVGGSVPARSYLVDGIKCPVPSNYDPVSRTYSGSWDGGSFKYELTDNPAWVLYDLLTNPRYGLGSDDLTQDQVDVWSFYRASKYNDEFVPDGRGGNEPRFTFNAEIRQRTEAIKLVQAIASAMRSNVVYSGGLITLCQDRPGDAVRLVSNSNVIDGKFTYSNAAKTTRYTAANVTWNDKNDRYLPKIHTLQDNAAIAAYGYNVNETAAFGCTSLGQAMREAKWILYTAQNQKDLVSYESSLAQFDLKINDIIKVYDEYLIDPSKQGTGRIVSVSANSVVLDKPVYVASGSTLSVVVPTADNSTGEASPLPQFVSLPITSGSGTYSNLTVSGGLSSSAVNALYQVDTPQSSRLYRVLRISQDEPGRVKVEAVSYDPAKYDYVDLGTVIDDGGGDGPGIPGAVGAPKNLQVVPTASVSDEGIKRKLTLSWDAPDSGTITSYTVKHRFNAGSYRTVQELTTRTFEVENAVQGTYDFEVRAVGVNGKLGPAASTSYVLNLDGIGDSDLDPPTTLRVVGGGTEFYTTDLVFEFMNPSTNAAGSKTTTIKEFKVDICNVADDAVIRTVTVPAVAAGQMTSHKYSFSDNSTDTGGPRRSLKIKVRIRDLNNKVTAAAVATLSNSAPAAVSNFTAEGMYKANSLKWKANTEKDIQGYHVWKGAGSFVPSAANHIFQGTATTLLDGPLPDNNTFTYKIAAYDLFNDPQDKTGNGLNIVTANATTTGEPGIPGSPTPPTGAAEGDFYYDTTDKYLFQYRNGVWRIVGMWTGTTAQMNANTRRVTGDVWSNTTDGKMYRWNGSAWVSTIPAVDITGNLTSDQIASLNVAKLSGKIGSYSTLFSGQIVAGDIATGAITSGKIAAGSITSNELAANSVTANKILAGEIQSTHLAASSVTAGKLAANSVSAANMQAGSITAANGAIANLSVGTLQIANGAISGTFSTQTTGSSVGMYVNVPENARTLSIMIFFGGARNQVYFDSNGKGGSGTYQTLTSPASGTYYLNGGAQAVGCGSMGYSFTNPAPYNYYVAADRVGGNQGFSGPLTIVAIVTYK